MVCKRSFSPFPFIQTSYFTAPYLQGDLIFIFILFPFLPDSQDFPLKTRKKIEHIDGFLHALNTYCSVFIDKIQCFCLQ